MASTVFPVPVASSLNASAITAATANTVYEGRATFDAAIYTVSCATSTIVNFQFLSGIGTIVATGVTASGTVAVNVPSNADRIRLWTNTGTDIVVTITRTAAALSNQFGTATLDTISTVGSSTYTGTSASGWAYAILVGGGGSGAGGGTTNLGGGGGGSGGVGGKLVQLTGSMPVFIGSGGAQASGNTNGNAGTASTFAGITAGGGGGGTRGVDPNAGGGGAGGTVTGADISTNAGGGVGFGIGGGGGTTANLYPFVINGTTGGGGGAGGNLGPTNGGGSGIGTGGRGADNTAGNPGTGFGSGGGGGYSTSGTGGAGRPGVLYILRF